jgi:hypothetical protein
MRKTYKPGDGPEASGIYSIIGPRGGVTPHQRTHVKGKPFPPTPRTGEGYRLKIKTKN